MLFRPLMARAQSKLTSQDYGAVMRFFEEQLEKAKAINDGMHNYKSKEDFCKQRENGIDLNNQDDTTLMMTYSRFRIVDFGDDVFKAIPRIRLKAKLHKVQFQITVVMLMVSLSSSLDSSTVR
jgi:hypothetical protein